MAKSICERAEQLGRIEQSLERFTGQRIHVEFAVEDGKVEATAAARPVSQQQRIKDVMQNPMIRRAAELFGAEPVKVEEPAAKE
jgi:hypothetical protein